MGVAFFAELGDAARRGADPEVETDLRGAARFLGVGGVISSAMIIFPPGALANGKALPLPLVPK
jgi:hypothetical protein